MLKRYRSKVIRFKGDDGRRARVKFVGGIRPYFWIGDKYVFLGWIDNSRDVRRLRQCCDEYLEAKEKS